MEIHFKELCRCCIINFKELCGCWKISFVELCGYCKIIYEEWIMQGLQHVRLMHHQFSSNDITSEGIPTRYIGMHFSIHPVKNTMIKWQIHEFLKATIVGLQHEAESRPTSPVRLYQKEIKNRVKIRRGQRMQDNVPLSNVRRKKQVIFVTVRFFMSGLHLLSTSFFLKSEQKHGHEISVTF